MECLLLFIGSHVLLFTVKREEALLKMSSGFLVSLCVLLAVFVSERLVWHNCHGSKSSVKLLDKQHPLRESHVMVYVRIFENYYTIYYVLTWKKIPWNYVLLPIFLFPHNFAS